MQVVQQEGPAALWKGNLATILHRLPYSAINFYTYEHMNKLLRRKLPPNTDFVRQLSSGAMAGLIACSAVSLTARECWVLVLVTVCAPRLEGVAQPRYVTEGVEAVGEHA